MMDLNFFEGYKVKRIHRDIRVTIALWIMILVFVGLALTIAYNYKQIADLDSDILQIENEIQTLSLNNNIERIREKEQLNLNLLNTVNNLEKVKVNIDGSTHINENLLAIITDALPIDVQLNAISISGNTVSVSGVAISKSAIAEFQYNFRESETISHVFVPSITNNGDDYSFSATLTIGGGK